MKRLLTNERVRNPERSTGRQSSRLVLILLLLCGLLFPGGARAAEPAAAGTGNAGALRTAETKAGKKLSVLMVGNSQIFSYKKHNVMISYLKKLGAAGGYTISVTKVVHDNERLKNYAKASTAHGKEVREQIRRKKWDVIILQENTRWAIARGKTFEKAAKKLVKYIRKNCPGAEIFLDATWAYNCTKKIGGHYYRKKTQQKNINANYKQAAKSSGAKVIWTGRTFAAYEKTKNSRNLYRTDKNHASFAGCYLHACCIYRAITGKNPHGLKYYGSLIRGKAQTLQRMAGEYAVK